MLDGLRFDTSHCPIGADWCPAPDTLTLINPRDSASQMCLARGVRSGQVFINNYGVELPFGGVGKSGHGRDQGH